jgi:putative DNA primase/helicase
LYQNTRQIYEEICHAVGKDPDSRDNGHCPAHEDATGSLSVDLGRDGKILIHCFAGCSLDEVLRQLGMENKDLFPSQGNDTGGAPNLPNSKRSGESPANKPKKKYEHVKADLRLEQLAHYVQIPKQELEKWGCREEEDDYYGRYVRIQCYDLNKKEYAIQRMRLRLKPRDGKNPKFKMRKGQTPVVYGEWFMERIRQLGWCVFVEGESDSWTLWHHGMPALGMPGANTVKKLRPEHLEGLKQIWVFCEPDRGGATFADAFSKRLAELDYRGQVYRLYLNDYKDPSELHKSRPDDFSRIMRAAMDLRKPLRVEAASKKKDWRRGKNLTDMGNGERLAMQHGQDIRYCHDWHKWLCWDGKRWPVDRVGEIKKKAKETVRTIYQEAAQEPDEDYRKKIIKHAQSSEAERAINGMIALASVEEGVPVVPERLDADPWLLTVENGTVDLQTGKLYPPRRDDLITKCCDVSYDSTAKCPTFVKFIDRIMDGNEGLITFLQRALGYSLTGRVVERSMFIQWGTGKNGKSTLLEVMHSILGDYSMRTPTDTLMVQYGGGSGIPNDIARLKGARFVSASESEEGQRLAESKIKDLTGGDTISARFMRGEFFDFRPEFKLWLATNHKPVIRGTDQAIWDRIKLIPFKVRIPKEEQDANLTEKLKSELPGIFQWLLRGCLDWQKHGLEAPPEVLSATTEYRQEMDDLGDFLGDCCLVNPELSVANKELYQEYRSWCEKNAMKMISQKRFSNRLMDRGFEQKKTNVGRKWLGMRLLEDWEKEQAGSDGLDESDVLDGFSHINNQDFSHGEGNEKKRHNPSPVTDDSLGKYYD